MAGVSLDAVWKTGAALPGVVRSTAYGSPALKVGGQLMACVPTNKALLMAIITKNIYTYLIEGLSQNGFAR
jgi:hypothetical protein